MSVAIIAIARLENDYINEWIRHHLNIGVDHIYVYDNSASDEEKIKYRISDEFRRRVTIIPAYDKEKYQIEAYKDGYIEYGYKYDYLIYIDIDEFIMLNKDIGICDFINRLPADCECYRMNWLIYGDSGIVNRDVSSSVVNDFTKPAIHCRGNTNTMTKSIIKGGLSNIDFISVHNAIRNVDGVYSNLKTYYGNMIDITDKISVKQSLDIGKIDYTYVQLNHYITKSICEFICQKMRRPDAARDYERTLERDFFGYNDKTPEKMRVVQGSESVLKYYYWFPTHHFFDNAGDYFNKLLINQLYNCKCEYSNDSLDIVLCGSVLSHPKIKNARYIVGSGIQNDNKSFNKNASSYLAVRGEISKQRLTNEGLNLWSGLKLVDPGLLVSKIYDFGEVIKKYKIGIIPHWEDEDYVVSRYSGDYKIISMKTCDVQQVCREICECDIVVSSSLHGLVFAHSFGIPSYYIYFKQHSYETGIKIDDYYSCYDSHPKCKKFECQEYVIPFKEILEYDETYRSVSNPTKEEIIKKQNDFLSVLPYRRYINKKYLYGKEKNINVCLTSHKARINKIRPLIDSILNQTIDCNIYLTLSSDEFPQKEKGLPANIENINDPRFHINWVKENITTFKKSLYTLHLLSDDAIIVTLDDDDILERDTIERGVRYFDGENPLTRDYCYRSIGYNGIMYRPGGCFQIYNKDMVKNWEKVINDDIIKTKDDDSFMIAMFWLNGYYTCPIPIKIKFDLELIHSEGVVTHGLSYNEFRRYVKGNDEIINESVQKITGKHLYDSFAYFNGGKSHRIPNPISEDVKEDVLIYSPELNVYVPKRILDEHEVDIPKVVEKPSSPKPSHSGIKNIIQDMNSNKVANRIIKLSTGKGFIWKKK